MLKNMTDPNELCSDYGGKWNENKDKTYNKIKRPF